MNSAIPLWDAYLKKKNENTNWKRYMRPRIHYRIIHNCLDVKKKKKIIYHGILFGHNKKAVWPLMTTWIKLEDIMLSEIPSDLTYMKNFKKQRQSGK